MNRLNIHVIGLGVEVPASLPANMTAVLAKADCVIGWQRHQAIVAPYISDEQFTQVTRLSEVQDILLSFNEQNNRASAPLQLCILASGDPLFFGIGKWLKRYENQHCLTYYPAVSSLQAACHRQRLSLQDVTVLSLHGRPLQTLRTQLKKNRILAVLTDQHSTPQVLAGECINAGFAQSTVTVHEDLGYPQERSHSFAAVDLVSSTQSFSSLHVSILDVKGKGQHTPEFPGIPDDFFETGTTPGAGMISKREVRLSVLSLMQPANGDVIWDIGAGCGGVAIELSYWNKKVQVYAVEYHRERLAYLKQNRERFGVVQNLHIIEGKAPDSLVDLPAPNKIFIGGNDGELQRLLELAWDILPVGGLLVASGVIESTRQTLTAFCEQMSQRVQGAVESVELSVKRGAVKDSVLHYIPKLPVEIFKLTKLDSDINGE